MFVHRVSVQNGRSELMQSSIWNAHMKCVLHTQRQKQNSEFFKV